MRNKVLVSVIIPCYNEEKDIVKCLESLNNQSYKNIEIIIVDDGSTDRSLEVIKQFLKVRVLKQEHRGPGRARNLGAKNAKGEILIFIDSDMTFDTNYVENLIKPIIEDKNGRVIGTTHELEIVKNVDNVWSRCWGKIRVSKEEAGNIKIFRAIRKKAFIDLEGFDPKYGYADDQTLWIKHKVKPIVAENTRCYHKNPETLKAVYKQSRWIGASIDKMLFRLPVINYLSLMVMIILSPIAIPALAVKRSYEKKSMNLLFPWMILFLTARYFGTVGGIFRRIALGKNFR